MYEVYLKDSSYIYMRKLIGILLEHVKILKCYMDC